MTKRRAVFLCAAFTVCAGGAYLATPAQAAEAAFFCTDEQLDWIINTADAKCDGGPWVAYAECTEGIAIITEIECV